MLGAAATLRGVYETVLYAEDVTSMTAFYANVLGFAVLDGSDDTGAGFRLPSGAVLLIFDPRRSSLPGRAVPSHGARGAGHVALRVDAAEIPAWRDWFEDLGVKIETDACDDVTCQLYVRDPAGNSLELAAGDLWPAA